MAKLGDLVAFRAAIELIKESGSEGFIGKLYEEAKLEILKPTGEVRNLVREIYRPFSASIISQKISSLLKSQMM